MTITYFTQLAREDENLLLTQSFITWLALRYNLEVKIIRSDNKINWIKTKNWCSNISILLKLCAPDTHTQNSGIERFDWLIMEKACAMRFSANLLHKLWKEIIATAIYFYNRTSRASNDWKLPYKSFHTYVFDKEQVSGPRKPQLHHLKAYKCKTYILTKLKKDVQYYCKLRKLDLKLHVNFLVSYESMNIYQIWVSHKKKVVSVQDIIFNKKEVWYGKSIQCTPNEIKEMNKVIKVIQ